MDDADRQLMKIAEAHSALQIARTLADVTQIRDMAAALKRYLQQRRYTFEIQQDAAELKLRAERKAGQLLIEIHPKKFTGRPTENKTHHAFCSLAGLGIEDTQSSRWQQIAGVSDEDFEQYIQKTREAQTLLTTSGMLRLAQTQRREEEQRERQETAETLSLQGRANFYTDLDALHARGHSFGCLYADPPWAYDNQGTRGSTHNHYGTMTVEQLCALPIKTLAASQSHLHLWTTNAFLFDCPKIFEAWGFEFKSALVWVKPQLGMGNYWRNSHEYLLLGVRGGLTARDHSLHSWLQADRKAHSAKPDQIRDLVEQLSPGPYLELFGRRPVQGWIVWGNEYKPQTERLVKTGKPLSTQQRRRSTKNPRTGVHLPSSVAADNGLMFDADDPSQLEEPRYGEVS